jgi:hypothetical protein
MWRGVHCQLYEGGKVRFTTGRREMYHIHYLIWSCQTPPLEGKKKREKEGILPTPECIA